LRLAILLAAIDKATVKATGKPSGIAETHKATTRKNIELIGCPLIDI
jgi:hypothetical protein